MCCDVYCLESLKDGIIVPRKTIVAYHRTKKDNGIVSDEDCGKYCSCFFLS